MKTLEVSKTSKV